MIVEHPLEERGELAHGPSRRSPGAVRTLHADEVPRAGLPEEVLPTVVTIDHSRNLPPWIYEQLRDVARRMMRSEAAGNTLQATAVVHEAWMRLARSGIDLTAMAGGGAGTIAGGASAIDTGDRLGSARAAAESVGGEVDAPLVAAGNHIWLPLASHIIRNVIIDHARQKRRLKRGGGAVKVSLNEQQVAAAGSGAAIGDAAGRGDGPRGLVSAGSDRSPLDLLALDEALEELGRIGPRQLQVVEMKFFGRMTTRQIAGVLGIGTRTVEDDWAAARAFLSRRMSAE